MNSIPVDNINEWWVHLTAIAVRAINTFIRLECLAAVYSVEMAVYNASIIIRHS